MDSPRYRIGRARTRSDPRVDQLKITPDPGVIEVNIHPSATWSELSKRKEILYDQAANDRLCAEKFMLDGRHRVTCNGRTVPLTPPRLMASLSHESDSEGGNRRDVCIQRSVSTRRWCSTSWTAGPRMVEVGPSAASPATARTPAEGPRTVRQSTQTKPRLGVWAVSLRFGSTPGVMTGKVETVDPRAPMTLELRQ